MDLSEQTEECLICVPAQRAERISHGVAALQQGIQAVRLLFQELNSLYLHPQHHPHLTLQAGKLVCIGERKREREGIRREKTDG